MRIHQWSDAADIFGYAQNPEVARFMPWNPHQSINDSYDFIARVLHERRIGKRNDHAIVWKQTGKVIGSCSYRLVGHRSIFGYALNQDYWGKGLATEASKKLIEVSFSHAEVSRVEAICDIENIGSARVMEKSGMKREGLLRQYILIQELGSVPKDVFMYSLLKSEYEAESGL